jgi:hypothetical protein
MVTVHPNQRAFPGMEDQAHPLARHLNDVQFQFSTMGAGTRREGSDTGYRAPLSFDMQLAREHSITAVAPSPRPNEAVFGTPGRIAGELHWKGETPAKAHYPGEITWVGRGEYKSEDIHRSADGGIWHVHNPFPKTPGLMTDMYKFAHQQVQPGQRTVPVHSPERTAKGEDWARRVGPEQLRPRRGDERWRPPPGIHPFERAGAPPQLAPHIKGQERLGDDAFWMRHANANSPIGKANDKAPKGGMFRRRR